MEPQTTDIFKEINISDKEWVDCLLSYSDYRSTEYNFTVLYIWKDVFKTRIARLGDFLLIRSGERQHGFTYLFPDIYSAVDMITLKGKKFQSKRNFVSRFKSNPEWSFEPITKENLHECRQMNEEWCKLYGCTKDQSLSQESCSVRCALKNFEALGLKGGLLRLAGKVVAFSLGEMLNSDTFLVHIEKAFANIQGAYPTISREFLLYCSNLDGNDIREADETKIGFKYVNREDDAGDEGLRKAKLQYHPVFMLEKYLVAELEK